MLHLNDQQIRRASAAASAIRELLEERERCSEHSLSIGNLSVSVPVPAQIVRTALDEQINARLAELRSLGIEYTP